MNPRIYTLLLLTLVLGTTITVTSSHWLLAWMGLELSTLAIIPALAYQHHPRAVEASTKYFLVQVTAAATILFAATMNASLTGEWDIARLSHPASVAMMTAALALKVGLAPLHFWLPEVLQGLDLTTGLIVLTWQKLAPFALLYQVSHILNPTLLILLGMSSTLIGGWEGLNQTQLRKIMAYSSIAHLGWMTIIIQTSPSLALVTLGIYIIMTTATFLTFKMTMTTKINTLALVWTKNPLIVTIAALTLLSLGGLPPLSGFIPKWLILQELTNMDLPLIATLMALSALLSLFFYLRLCYAMILTISPNINNSMVVWRLHSTQPMLPTAFTTTLSLMLLPLTPTILMFIE
uniref:NADH-ubiquinone oxidoreductase chain 2 n=1 Tax=Brycon orbignyanus TaxID=126315 RepID=A0A088QMX4_9TELE|nr:NADH dehydrogenase subunit 2 [Brycon orbignyanus]AIN79127.1 NADH dehydrogenase subunit 2 [Brycon orbignyanus]ARS00862.1 NADH dehydrogenase subunit 2 [Brycon orbignyanus]